LKILDI